MGRFLGFSMWLPVLRLAAQRTDQRNASQLRLIYGFAAVLTDDGHVAVRILLRFLGVTVLRLATQRAEQRKPHQHSLIYLLATVFAYDDKFRVNNFRIRVFLCVYHRGPATVGKTKLTSIAMTQITIETTKALSQPIL